MYILKHFKIHLYLPIFNLHFVVCVLFFSCLFFVGEGEKTTPIAEEQLGNSFGCVLLSVKKNVFSCAA